MKLLLETERRLSLEVMKCVLVVQMHVHECGAIVLSHLWLAMHIGNVFNLLRMLSRKKVAIGCQLCKQQ